MQYLKKTIQVGAFVAVLSQFYHPCQHIRYKYPNRIPTHHLEILPVICRDIKKINVHDQVAIAFYHDDYPNVELYSVKKYTKVATKGMDSDLFQ